MKPPRLVHTSAAFLASCPRQGSERRKALTRRRLGDQMLVDDVGDVTVTNDGATILKLLEVEHPAAKARALDVNRLDSSSVDFLLTRLPRQILVELAELQDAEVGDGTTSVVIIAAELLKRAGGLVRDKIHPTTIISGYRQAMRQACTFLDQNMAIPVASLGPDTLLNAARTSLSSKIVGVESDFFSRMVVEAITAVKTYNDVGDAVYPVKAINILKAHGRSAKESRLLDGYALNMGVSAQGMIRRVTGARIACLDVNLQKSKMALGVQVLVTDPKELERIRSRESDATKERIQLLLAAGANVVLTTKGIDDMALKYFVEAGAMACRRVPKDDLRRVAKATGATVITTFGDMEGNESFDPAYLGTAVEVREERVCDDDMVLIQGTGNTSSKTLLLRGANDYLLDEMERSLHDALCVVKRVLESGSVVPGGGACEAALSVHLERISTTMGSREAVAVNEFGDALLVIPKTLANNAAKDATELVAKLRAAHALAQQKAVTPREGPVCAMGLDLVEGAVRDNVAAGVLEPAMSKSKILQFATEAAITVLRIDDLIRLEPEGQGE